MKKKNYVYVSGPMTGIKDNNVPAFNAAAKALRKAGYKVINPADYDNAGPALPWEECLRRDLTLLCQKCYAVALLDNWEDSRGATLEVHVAEKLGMIVGYVSNFLSRREVRPYVESV